MDKYGIIGYPLKHSFSNKFFTEKFQKENIDAKHTNYEIESIDLFPEIINSEPELKGLNVTIPYKEQVTQFLNEIDDTAKSIGAVNVIRITHENGKPYLKGFNSDLMGFRDSIQPLMNPDIHHKALILGTGGASKAVFHGLKNLNIESKYVTRTPKEGMFTYEDLTKEVLEEYTVIVNTTPLGTFPDVDVCADIPYQYLGEQHLLYDLVYNPPLTKFLELGKKQGAKTKNGAEMFELQAIATWKIWNKIIP
ncbi:MAG: shikimate dehydrogenase [Dysgonomonas sp.]|nr:shikimate dehydrogenase [Dysgonomonas sp.]